LYGQWTRTQVSGPQVLPVGAPFADPSGTLQSALRPYRAPLGERDERRQQHIAGDNCPSIQQSDLAGWRKRAFACREGLTDGEVLGGHRVLGKPGTSLLELNDAVERGLPKATLRNVARHVFSDAAEQRAMMHRIVPEATFKRRRERLSPAESERTERLARVVATAEDVWHDREQARRFLTTPHPEIGGKTPLDAALTELGARQAEEVMARIIYGLPA
jgi:putative toxin-antitoxin system antitoxin component (TIGR02293 family)